VSGRPPHRRGPAADTAPTDTYQAVPLPGGAIVLVPHRAPLTDHDLDVLRTAAAPLTAALARLHSPTEGA